MKSDLPRTPVELPILKLPRKVELDPRYAKLSHLLIQNCKPLWAKSTIQISQLAFSEKLETALLAVQGYKHLEPGLEQIDQRLGNEKKGLTALLQKQGTSSSLRISRLLIVANDGSERFYRACESTLIKNGDRLRLLRVDVPSERMVEKLFGRDRAVKALLVSDRDAVTQVLLSLVE